MNRFSAKIRRLSRQLGAKPTVDPDGVLAVLQVARRLLKEQNITPDEALLQAADEFAAPKDPVIAFWTAHKALTSVTPDGAVEDWDSVFAKAVENQGRMNQLVKRGPK